MINYSGPYAGSVSNDSNSSISHTDLLDDLQRMVTDLGPSRSLTRALDTLYVHYLDYPIIKRSLDRSPGPFGSMVSLTAFSPKLIRCEPTIHRYQFRFPRSKKRRIRKKWAKDPRNYREEVTEPLVNRGEVIAINWNSL